MTTALVIGATGLVGRAVVKSLLGSPSYSKVIALTRRTTGVKHEKYEEHLVDFGKPESFAALVKGDVLFSCMGTTRGQAGSIDAQRTVDYTYQLEVAKLAASNGVKTYVLISSASANAGSPIAYSKMKGELERDVKGLGFSSVQILQPGLLVGEREKARSGERVAETVLRAINAVGILRSLRPISGDTVARAALRVATMNASAVHKPAELFSLAEDR